MFYLARVAATDVRADPSATTARITYGFDENIQYRVKEFRVDLTPTEGESRILYKGPDSRAFNFNDLEPGESYKVTVVAVYTDDKTAVAETTFQTLGMTASYCEFMYYYYTPL